MAAGVFDVMRQRLLYVAHVTGFKVHCSRAASCGEHGHAPLAADEELPFVSIGMPVQLAQTTGLQGDQRGGDILRDLEIARVNDAHLAALCALCRRLLHGAKGKIDRRGSQCSRRPALVLGKRSGDFGLKNEPLLVGHNFHGRPGHYKISRNDVLRRMRHPVGQQNRLIFREVAIVKHQQEFRAVGREPLDGVRYPRREIPEIPFLHVGDETLSVGIDTSDARRPI